MSNSVQFLHLADLHIGARITRFEEDIYKKLLESRFQALDNALNVARDKSVDFVLISGDLFDDNAVSLTDTQRVYDRLKEQGFPVYVLPGNHDPCCAGSIWQRHPWDKTEGTSIHVLCHHEPEVVRDGVTLYPCPVTSKTSCADPTNWIPLGEAGADIVRIGLAHGSVMDRDTLPEDDHPIPVNTTEVHQLDYLALGHWHAQKLYSDTTGAKRMAYPGTHEQMSFSQGSGFSIGWSAYVKNPNREEFLGATKGSALLVKIPSHGAVPVVESIDVGQYVWTNETIEVTDEVDLNTISSSLAQRSNPERELLRIKLKGVLSAEGIVQLDAFRNMLNRYLYCDLHTDELHLKPSDEDLHEVVGQGVLCGVLDRIRDRLQQDISDEECAKHERALVALYRLTKEVAV